MIIKLHPDNNYNLYRLRFNSWEAPRNVHLVKNEFTPHELLGIASAFATVYSTLALEALVNYVPVITLDYTKVDYRLNLEPAAVSVKSLDELNNLLKNENWVDDLNDQVKKNRDHILDRELVNLGFAAEKAAEELVKLNR